MGWFVYGVERMIFTCYSESCEVHEDCECNSECCSGVKTKPTIITYISDQEIKTNNPHSFPDVSEDAIEELCLHHVCPFCFSYVEC